MLICILFIFTGFGEAGSTTNNMMYVTDLLP